MDPSVLRKGESEQLYTENQNKQNLLEAFVEVENEITKLGNYKLEERLKDLREQVEIVLQNYDKEIKNQDEEIKNLCGEIQNLKKEVASLKTKNKELEKNFAVAQATWAWEAHLARFVVDHSERIYKDGRFHQMSDFLQGTYVEQNRWTEIQRKFTTWTGEHWRVVNNVRKERNAIAHPDLFNLDLVEYEMAEMSPKYQERMGDMLDILKLTASLMKFGRLAKFYQRNNHQFPLQRMRERRMAEDALKCIVSWDRHFEEIDGLQNIEHEEAKRYLAKYVDDSQTIKHYFIIVDSIKQASSKRLGKLAWEIETRRLSTRMMSTGEIEALNELKKLLPNPVREPDVKVLDATIAKLHISDFLPKHLWKHGIKIVDFKI